ncbi:MAG: formate dehydrogenase [Hyphomicrobiaceae bacterium]
MTNKSDAKKTVDRRGLLKFLGHGAAGSAAVAATGVAVMPGTAAAAESAADRVKKRYRETDHVKAFYRTNRY